MHRTRLNFQRVWWRKWWPHLSFNDPLRDGRFPIIPGAEFQRCGAGAYFRDNQVWWGSRKLWNLNHTYFEMQHRIPTFFGDPRETLMTFSTGLSLNLGWRHPPKDEVRVQNSLKTEPSEERREVLKMKKRKKKKRNRWRSFYFSFLWWNYCAIKYNARWWFASHLLEIPAENHIYLFLCLTISNLSVSIIALAWHLAS